MKAVREAMEGALVVGVDFFSLFAASTENWNRPVQEVAALMGLLQLYVRKERHELRRQGVEVHVLGDLERVDDATRRAIETIVEGTRGGTRLRLNLMVSYGGREELVRSVRVIADRVRRGELSLEEVDATTIEDTLFTRGLPSPDLLIRTSGECRISNFMLWQLAYTELHITPVLWPDFDRANLFEAVLDYQGRERRFGTVGSS